MLKNKTIKSDALIVLLLLVTSGLLRLPGYAELSIIPDEILYSDYAYSIIGEKWGWPQEEMFAQPPFFPYLLAIQTYLFEGSLNILRIVPIFFGVLDVLMVYYLGKLIYNQKIGLLSALFLAFFSYHIYYSRSLMIETTLIFFILASMYFFWKTCEEEGILNAILAGFFLGMANNTKYAAFLLYPIFISYLLWTRRNGISVEWKMWFEKKFLVMISVSILVFLPVLIDLIRNNVNPFYWQLFERYKLQFAGYKPISEFGITELMISGFDNYCGMLMDATSDISRGLLIKTGSVATLSLPWLVLFELAVYFLLPATILYYLYYTLQARPGETFIFIAFAAFNAFAAVFATRFQYYLLWNAPLFFIMMAKIAVDCSEKLKSQEAISAVNLKKSICLLVLVCTGIAFLSYLYIGTLAPFVNESIKVGYENNIIKIKSTISHNDSIATDRIDLLQYYLFKYDIGYVAIIPLYRIERINQKKYLKVNLDMLEIVKPRYISVSSYSFSSYATIYDRAMIQKDYVLISNENEVLLFENKSYFNK